MPAGYTAFIWWYIHHRPRPMLIPEWIVCTYLPLPHTFLAWRGLRLLFSCN